MRIKFDIITIFPEIFKSFSQEALIARAQVKGIIEIAPHFLRDSGEGPHRKVDDRPYGGGAGMVMMVAPIARELAKISAKRPEGHLGGSASIPKALGGKKSKIIVFSAKGKQFTQAMARRYAKLDQLIMICGRYEGIDERVAQHLADEEISVGPYVLFGGEVPAMMVMEAVTRLLPGALGKPESLKEESFSGRYALHDSRYTLEYPHYTRPEVFEINKKNRRVPPVLISGNHAKIEAWRKSKSKTR